MSAAAYPITAFLWIAATEAVTAIAPSVDMWQVLFQYGGLGAMLCWFMFRVEKRMEKQLQSDQAKTAALERNSQSLMIAVASMKNLDSAFSEMAKGLAADAEQAQKETH